MLSRYFTCGSTALGTEAADTYRLQLSVVSTVLRQGSGSRLETTVEAIARQPGTSSAPVNCSSTGELEKAIANRVSVAVGG
jgi:citrate lyase gamma subunit